ncbi:hypothetical protein V2K16_24695 [Pseudomonas alliivorans]|uniref:hypothetical protein n=1 Tax=Pseudomonas TaxID=286 RepID=UPI001AE9671D|nr:hypothetical protein [Pseudomonas alliivorans]MBP0943377.1 hypothetical protein [Pseudomonas alliivorans]MEE4881398.1 hypothetical protein [Pseudomonas alliivorans]MEE4932879.1 hypothetical protein [Pseudomonas alliivorans]MEE4938243.1 hypothetical protein [Pseudomonas alliivorans]MEE4943338.1 hypothetical protein [Pseudomonas alliivorans]
MCAFDREVDQFSLGYVAPIHLLTSATWDDRVLAAWCLIGSEQRALAKKLVADEAYNFWPDTRFCDPVWDEHVQVRLAAINAGETVNAQFDIVDCVGQPAQDRLEFVH